MNAFRCDPWVLVYRLGADSVISFTIRGGVCLLFLLGASNLPERSQRELARVAKTICRWDQRLSPIFCHV